MRGFWFALPLAAALTAARLHAAAAPAADAAALGEIVTAYERSIRSGDVSKSGIRKNLAAGFSAVLPSGQLIGSYGDLSKAENALRTMVGRGTRYESTEVVVDPLIEVGGDLAAFTGRTVSKATAQAGKNLAFTTFWSAVARKEDGAWRLLRHQAVMDPSTNPWHQDESTGPGWGLVLGSGLLGGLAGAVLGFAAARVLGGRSRPATGGSPAAPEPSRPTAARTRAWNKEAAGGPAPSDPTATTPSAQARSWERQAAGDGGAAVTQPADPPADPPADESATDESAPPPSGRTERKRAWEN